MSLLDLRISFILQLKQKERGKRGEKHILSPERQ